MGNACLKSWVVLVNQSKVYFYDYLSEKTVGVPSPAPLKTCCVVDHNSLCFGCKDGSLALFDCLKQQFTKSVKSYHKKPIRSLIPFQVNSKPQILSSSKDGLLAS